MLSLPKHDRFNRIFNELKQLQYKPGGFESFCHKEKAHLIQAGFFFAVIQ